MNARRAPRGRRQQRPTTTQPEAFEVPARVRRPPFSSTPSLPPMGAWVWTCRAGAEDALFEELAWARATPTPIAPGLIASRTTQRTPTFARTGFSLTKVVHSAHEVLAALPSAPAHVQVWVPDTESGNRLQPDATAWQATIAEARPAGPLTPWAAFEAHAWLPQVCLVAPSVALFGLVKARQAVSLAAGGRDRQRRSHDAPSRAAMKLDEALAWAGIAPAAGEVCVDLGSAPGGWTRKLLALGARVESVDPGQLAPDVAKHPKVHHHSASAFTFEPPRPVDWLFCDMAWRPLEVAQLLAKWARRGWARQLVANLKLPMRDTLPMVQRCLWHLGQAGWTNLHCRQLYHDRDEVTVRGVCLQRL